MKEKDYHYTAYSSRFLEQVRELRRNMTRQENHLWYDFLRDYPVKFYKQRPIGRYIADFYCSNARLVIEVDGSQHFTEEGFKYDAARTNAMRELGLEVLRFSNDEVDKHFEGVCTRIDEHVKNRKRELFDARG